MSHAQRVRRLAGAVARRRSPSVVFAAGGLGLAGIALFALPLGALALLTVSPALFGQSGGWLTLHAYGGLFTGDTAHALLDSLLVGTGAGTLAVAVAIPLAWALERYRLAGAGLWAAALWCLLLAPTYLMALGLELITQSHGPLQAVVGADPSFLRSIVMGPVGVIWILGMHGLPLAVLALRGAVAGLNCDLDDAARAHGVSRWRRRATSASLITPALISAFAIVFAEAISDFGVASTLAADSQFPVATNTIYEQIGTFPVDFSGASAISAALVALIGVALLLQVRASNRGSYATIGGRNRRLTRARLSRGAALGWSASIGALFALALGVPLLALLATSFLAPGQTHLTFGALTLGNYSRALADRGLVDPLLLSLRLAAIAATGCVLLGAIVAPLLVRRRRRLRHATLDLMLLATVGIPSIVVGVGFLFAYNLPFVYRLLPIYGTNTLLAAGYLAGQTPIAARLLAGRAAQLQPSLTQAARIHGHGPLRSWRQAVLPLLAPSLLRAWLLIFAVVMFELPLSEILHPPGVPPLAVAITHQLRYDYAGGTALTAIAALITLAVIAVVAGLYRLLAPRCWREPGRKPGVLPRVVRPLIRRFSPAALSSSTGVVR